MNRELLEDLAYAYCTLLRLLWLAVWSLGIVVVLPLASHAGSPCYSCNHAYVAHEVAYTPTTVIEHQEVNQFVTVGDGIQRYASVTPPAIAAAKAFEYQSKIGELQDLLNDFKNGLQQPAAAPMPQAGYCLPVGYKLVPCDPQPTQQQQPVPRQPMPAPSGSPQSSVPTSFDPNGIVENKCYSCHSGANPKGKLALDKVLTCEQALRAIKAVTSGKMPKGGPELTDAEKGAFNAEMLKVSLASKSPNVVYQDVTPGGLGPQKPWPPKDLPITPAPLPLPTPENTTDAENY